MAISVIAVGKRHESWIKDGVERYQKRLQRPYDVSWILLPHSPKDELAARQDESQRITTRLKSDDFVILLDESGKIFDSPQLAAVLQQPLELSRNVTIVIGGAYGVNDGLRARADVVWSLSKLVFPHQLVRLILIEQLYRSQEIIRGNPYHHV